MNKRFIHILIFLFVFCLCILGCLEEAPIDVTYTVTNKSGSLVTDVHLAYYNPDNGFEKLENNETIRISFRMKPMVIGSHIRYYINGKLFDVQNERDAYEDPEIPKAERGKISRKYLSDGCTAVIEIYADDYTIEIVK